MSDEWSAYTDDSRIPCKYGSKCYQKNSKHHSTYKHPPIKEKVTENRTRKRCSPYTREEESNKTDKKPKTEEGEHPLQEVENKHFEGNSDGAVNKIELPHNLTYYDNADYAALQELFLVDMPKDFFKFYEVLNDDGAIVKTLGNVNLELIGPYELLMGKLPKVEDKELYLVHWRYFYDPPEFQAVLKKKGNSEYHIGYFRDNPKEKPVFIGSNDSAKNCDITILAENIFGAVYHYLQKSKGEYPFNAIPCQRLMNKIKKYAEEHGFTVSPFNMKKRKAEQVTNTLHHAGIVVPYNKKTQLGYRPLVENDATLKKIFADLKSAKTREDKDKYLSELQPVITYASIALDEYDFGTGLELGIDLFCSGIKDLEEGALNMLTTVYGLLNREEFGKIIKAHLKYRRKGPNMSITT